MAAAAEAGFVTWVSDSRENVASAIWFLTDSSS